METLGYKSTSSYAKKTNVSVSRNINCRFNSYRANFNIKSKLLEQNNGWLRIHFRNIFKYTIANKQKEIFNDDSDAKQLMLL